MISDEYGVFVSPTGIDATAKGTQALPFATVTAALASISNIKHVYVCAGAGDYIEPDTLQIPDRVSIYGGFTCTGGTWQYDSPAPAHLISSRPIGAMITNASGRRGASRSAPGRGERPGRWDRREQLWVDDQWESGDRAEARGASRREGREGEVGGGWGDGVGWSYIGRRSEWRGGDVHQSACVADWGPVGNQDLRIARRDWRNCICRDCLFGHAGRQHRVSRLAIEWREGRRCFRTGGDSRTRRGSRCAGRSGTGCVCTGTFSATGYKVASGGTGVAGKPGQGGGGGWR